MGKTDRCCNLQTYDENKNKDKENRKQLKRAAKMMAAKLGSEDDRVKEEEFVIYEMATTNQSDHFVFLESSNCDQPT